MSLPEYVEKAHKEADVVMCYLSSSETDNQLNVAARIMSRFISTYPMLHNRHNQMLAAHKQRSELISFRRTHAPNIKQAFNYLYC